MNRRSRQRWHCALDLLRRSLIAAGLVVSLLSTVIPFSAASSVHWCTMECCVGKPPHAAGACDTNLMKSAPRESHDAEAFCGLHRHNLNRSAARSAARKYGAVATSQHRSCGHRIDSANDGAAPETTGSASAHSPSVAAPSMTTPCTDDCGAGSISFVRKPRPRAAPAARAGQARPLDIQVFQVSFQKNTPLPGHYQQSQPRGPPVSLS